MPNYCVCPLSILINVCRNATYCLSNVYCSYVCLNTTYCLSNVYYTYVCLNTTYFLSNVLPCTNYDSTNLRNYLSFEITFLDAFRLLLCKPSSGALDFPHFIGFFPPVLLNTIQVLVIHG
jgi:hypothetical protein